MATTFKRVAWVSLGNVLTTELNSLANGGYSAFGTAYDNSSGLYLYGALLVNLASLTPAAGGYLQLFRTISLDGTNYDDAPASTNISPHLLPDNPSQGLLTLISGAAATKRAQLFMFTMSAALHKFSSLNGSGVALAASANTVALYGAYDQGV